MSLKDLYETVFEEETFEKTAEVQELEAAGQFIARGFYSEMEKIALSPAIKAGLIGAGVGGAVGTGVGALHGALANTEAGKKSYKGKAEAAGIRAGTAANIRARNTMSYALNPHSEGPLTEISSRLQRRHAAAMTEHPYKSSLIPFYSLIKGGKHGEKELKKAKNEYKK